MWLFFSLYKLKIIFKEANKRNLVCLIECLSVSIDTMSFDFIRSIFLAKADFVVFNLQGDKGETGAAGRDVSLTKSL